MKKFGAILIIGVAALILFFLVRPANYIFNKFSSFSPFSLESAEMKALTGSERNDFEDYLRQNISVLSPEKEVLGGKFYITKITWSEKGAVLVEYEDGHIALRAETFPAYTVGSDGRKEFRTEYFRILPEIIPEKKGEDQY